MSTEAENTKKAPPGSETWRIPAKRDKSEYLEFHVKIEHLDENPLIFEQYAAMSAARKPVDATAVVIKGIHVGGCDVDKIISNPYAIRTLIPKVVDLMEVEEVEVKKN